MHNPDAAGSPRASRWRAYTWGVLAALTCPCHLPVLLVLLSGTAAGAFVAAHIIVAAAALTALFMLFAVLTWRAGRRGPS